ncbi:MAG TPA: HEAT repeat domain-containing protein [Chthonomonadaceae bacterium]|nr:HEAT repeat domain-containing protein [Chthonomonadaceae bacterium]
MSVALQQASPEITEFLDKIKSPNGDIRMAAWQSAGPMGSAAIEPLGELAAGNDKGIAKAATEAMRVIAHHAARTGFREAGMVSSELLKIAASDKPIMVRSDALQLLGCIGNTRFVPGLVKLLADPKVQEEARMALERIPGIAPLDALQAAAKQAEADHSGFAQNLEQSLYNRTLTPTTVGTQLPKK